MMLVQPAVVYIDDQDMEQVAVRFAGTARTMDLVGSVWYPKEYRDAVVEALSCYVQDELRSWTESEAAEIFRTDIERLKDSVERDIQGILSDLDELQIMLDPSYSPRFSSEAGSFERIAAAVGSLAVGNIGGAITGGILGARAAIAQVGATIAIHSVLYMIGLLNPFTTLLTAAAMTGFFISVASPGRLQEIKIELARQMANDLVSLPESSERSIRGRTFEVINGLADTIHSGVSAVLGDLEKQLESARKDIAKNSAEAIKRLSATERNLEGLSLRLGALAESWGGME